MVVAFLGRVTVVVVELPPFCIHGSFRGIVDLGRTRMEKVRSTGRVAQDGESPSLNAAARCYEWKTAIHY